jgi:hypothetical protein
MKLIALLDSFGTDDKNLAQAAMTAFDADHLFAVIENKEALSPLAELENVPVRGAVTGEVVRVSSKEEIMPERYQKLSDREKARLAREDVWQTTRVANRVVVVDGPLGSMSDFVEIRDPETGEVTQKKTEWDDLRYAYAILVDTSYWRERHGDDFEAAMKEDLSVLFDTPQLKNRVKGIGALPEDLLAEGSAVAVSFTDKAVYPGENARLAFEEPSIDKLAIPDVTVDEVKRVEGGTFSTAEVFREMKRHPLAEWNKLGDNAGRTFIERFKTVFLEKFPKPDRPVQWLNETLDRATLFDKEEGVSTEVQLNENPRFGLRDTNRYLNDFWPINHAQITAIRELLKEGYTIHYSISNLRNIRDQREVLAATLAALAEGGVLGHKNFKVGVNLSTLANVMQAGDYLKWVDYLAVDFENLAYNLNALDPVAQEKVPFGIIKDDEIMAILPRPFRLILGALLDAGKPIFLDAESAPPMLERISREDRRLRTKKEMARALTLLRTELEDTLSPETIRDLRELAFRLQTLSYRPVFDRDTVRRVHDALAQDDTLPERFPEFWLELKDFLRAEMMAAVSEEERQEQESVEKRTLNITPGSNTPWLLERFAQNGIHKSA